MRLWSLHPRYLDSKGLVAAWREGLLAQKVLEGQTRGYTHHPQLDRFRSSPAPVASIARYLASLALEADARGYRFDRSKIHAPPSRKKIPVTWGQAFYELALLRSKLEIRDRAWLETAIWLSVPGSGDTSPSTGNDGDLTITLNTAFRPVAGDIESWERVKKEI